MSIRPSEFSESEKATAREFLLLHKPFLRSICNIDNQRQLAPLLAVATDKDLDCLAYVIFLQSQHQIPVYKIDRDKIVRGKRYPKLRQFMRKSTDYDHFKTLERSEKITQLRELGFALKLVLNPLFYRNSTAGLAAVVEDQGVARAERLREELSSGVKK